MIPELRMLTACLPDNPLFFYSDGLLVDVHNTSMSPHSTRHTARITQISSLPTEEITRTDLWWSHMRQYGIPCGTSLRITLGYTTGNSEEVNFLEDLDEMPYGYAELIARNPSTPQQVSYQIVPTHLGEKISVKVALNGNSQQFNCPIGSHDYDIFLKETTAITQKAIARAGALLALVRATIPQWVQEN